MAAIDYMRVVTPISEDHPEGLRTVPRPQYQTTFGDGKTDR